MYTSDTIQQVRDIPAADIIGARIKLKRNGAKWVGLCPFHDEKSGSFMVDVPKNTYKCFGCGEGGDVIDFVMKFEKRDFANAVETLANEKGIVLQYAADTMTPEQRKEQKSEKDAMYEMMEYVCSLYEMALEDEQRDALHARGVTDEDIKTWRIGYAPNAWRTVTAHVVNNGKLPMAAKLDLVKVKEDKNGDVKHYDTFRHRIMLPIRDEQGRVIGFGAWNYSQEQNADGKVVKYINSAETPLYKKTLALYGIDKAKPHMIKGKTAGITEGYFDVITAHRHDMLHVVGTCGTAITEEHMKLISKWSVERVQILQDNDNAGKKAKLKTVDMVISHGMLPMVACWDEQIKDLDELLRNQTTTTNE